MMDFYQVKKSAIKTFQTGCVALSEHQLIEFLFRSLWNRKVGDFGHLHDYFYITVYKFLELLLTIL